MEPLIPIGQFAKLTSLSIQALRRYADGNLFLPAWIDPETGYRYYRKDLVERAWMIRLLRAADMPHDVRVKSVPPQPYIHRRATIGVTELDRFLADSIRDLRAEAPAAGAPFAIFHKEVTPETRGDVEVRLPVTAAVESGAVMPAATVAYIIVEGEETDFPAILTAYDAAAEWALKHGRELDGPPREVYLSDHFAGETPKMEIAWTVK